MQEIKWKTDEKIPAELDKYLFQLAKSGYLTTEANGTTFELVNEYKSEMSVEEMPVADGESTEKQEFLNQTHNEHVKESEWQDGHIRGYDPIFEPETSIIDKDIGVDNSFINNAKGYLMENNFIADTQQQTDLSYGLLPPVQMKKIAESFLKADPDNVGYIRMDRLRECLKDAEISANEEALLKIERPRSGDSTVDWATYFFLCQSACKPYNPGEGIRI